MTHDTAWGLGIAIAALLMLAGLCAWHLIASLVEERRKALALAADVIAERDRQETRAILAERMAGTWRRAFYRTTVALDDSHVSIELLSDELDRHMLPPKRQTVVR